MASTEYSQEDLKRCKDVLGKKDYYEILGIPRTATEDEIKKAYRKLALRLHPDKNKAPQAEEAFKQLSKACACLTDKEKRTFYDQYGTEETQQQFASHFRDGSFDPNDIFRAFFQQDDLFGFPQQGNGTYRVFRTGGGTTMYFSSGGGGGLGGMGGLFGPGFGRPRRQPTPEERAAYEQRRREELERMNTPVARCSRLFMNYLPLMLMITFLVLSLFPDHPDSDFKLQRSRYFAN